MKVSRNSLREYSQIHYWLKHNFGVADHCENKECPNKSKIFTWALLRDKDYEKKRENFIQLCRPCHARYDCTTETREKMRKSRLGKIMSDDTKEKIRLGNLGKKQTMKSRKKMRENMGKPCVQLNDKKEPIKIWDSQIKAIRGLKLKIQPQTISLAIRTGYKTGGFYWKHAALSSLIDSKKQLLSITNIK